MNSPYNEEGYQKQFLKACERLPKQIPFLHEEREGGYFYLAFLLPFFPQPLEETRMQLIRELAQMMQELEEKDEIDLEELEVLKGIKTPIASEGYSVAFSMS